MDSKYRKEIRYSGFLKVPAKNNDCFRGFKKLSGLVGFQLKNNYFALWVSEENPPVLPTIQPKRKMVATNTIFVGG